MEHCHITKDLWEEYNILHHHSKWKASDETKACQHMLAASILQDLHTNKGVTADSAQIWKIKLICHPTVSPTINKYDRKKRKNISIAFLCNWVQENLQKISCFFYNLEKHQIHPKSIYHAYIHLRTTRQNFLYTTCKQFWKLIHADNEDEILVKDIKTRFYATVILTIAFLWTNENCMLPSEKYKDYAEVLTRDC